MIDIEYLQRHREWTTKSVRLVDKWLIKIRERKREREREREREKEKERPWKTANLYPFPFNGVIGERITGRLAVFHGPFLPLLSTHFQHTDIIKKYCF